MSSVGHVGMYLNGIGHNNFRDAASDLCRR